MVDATLFCQPVSEKPTPAIDPSLIAQVTEGENNQEVGEDSKPAAEAVEQEIVEGDSEMQKEEFQRWSQGKTGYLLVDAGMRQLNQTGYMPNRVRMVVASFLCKHLLIDWRWGASYFAKKLLDYELSSNNGNWQWVAGTGCDAAPYFRVFNPIIQLKRFDPHFNYVKKWVSDYNLPSYPKPMVDHRYARERCLIFFKDGLK